MTGDRQQAASRVIALAAEAVDPEMGWAIGLGFYSADDGEQPGWKVLFTLPHAGGGEYWSAVDCLALNISPELAMLCARQGHDQLMALISREETDLDTMAEMRADRPEP